MIPAVASEPSLGAVALVDTMTAVATAVALTQKIKVVMFDQYGTVVDMQKGLTEIAAPFLQAKRWTGNPGSFVTWWRRTHFENSMIDALLHRLGLASAP